MDTRDDTPATDETLSAAARAAVRGDSDPRLDAHLAAILGGPAPAAPAQSRSEEELERLRRSVADLERAVARHRTWNVILAIALVVAVVLLVASRLLV